MKNTFLFLFFILLNSCTWEKIEELGNNFAIVEADEVFVNYDWKGNEENYFSPYAINIICAHKVDYNNDENWIIIRSYSYYYNSEIKQGEEYWIIDKNFVTTETEYRNEVEKRVIGPLDSIGFVRQTDLLNIKLKFKD